MVVTSCALCRQTALQPRRARWAVHGRLLATRAIRRSDRFPTMLLWSTALLHPPPPGAGGSRNPKDQQYMKMTLNQMLVELDGFKPSEGARRLLRPCSWHCIA